MRRCQSKIPTKLSTTVNKIKTLLNQEHAGLILEFHEFMKENGASERHQNNNLKAILSYSQFLGPRHLKNINKKEMVIKLYNEGKSTREIAKEVKISLRDIGIILREYYKEPEPEKSKSNRARSIEMFRE